MKQLTELLTRIAERFMPSPFVITIFLTLIVFVVAMSVASQSPLEVMSHWHKGFWELLTFTMQMALILVFGYVLASTPMASRLIEKIIAPLTGTAPAAAVISLIAMLMSFLNWGLGLVFGAILARRFAESAKRRGMAIHYPLIGAAAYSGLVIWHGGLSGSAPLTVATEGHFLAEKMGVLPVSETIFSMPNLITTALLLTVLPLVFYKLGKSLTPREVELDLPADAEATAPKSDALNDRLDHSNILGTALGAVVVAYLLSIAVSQGDSLRFISLNYVNFMLLGLGLLLHRSLAAYGAAFDRAMKSAAGILLLFPFYAGIMGIMKYSGLTEIFSSGIAAAATETTFPLFAFLSSGVVNVFVPSGGGQWVVQGPILIGAALENGISIQQTLMAFSYGDELTNMLQPFWALPLLGITGLKAKEILPFCVIVLCVALPIFCLGIYLF